MKKLFFMAAIICSLLSSCSKNDEENINNNTNEEAEEPFKVLVGFIDPLVKQICVLNWDTDRDGEISINEARAVSSLGYVFSGNNSIRHFSALVNFTGLSSIPDRAFSYCSKLEQILIPPSIKSIGDYAFLNTNLGYVAIPDGVESIGYRAFHNSNEESSPLIIDCKAITPPLLKDGDIGDCIEKIYVPQRSVSAYKNSSDWSAYKNIITGTNY